MVKRNQYWRQLLLESTREGKHLATTILTKGTTLSLAHLWRPYARNDHGDLHWEDNRGLLDDLNEISTALFFHLRCS